jgi:hypothetical protein
VGNLTTLVEQSGFAVLGADNPLAVESMKRTTAQMKTELAGDRPTRLEQMLVDQIVAVWMEFSCLQAISASARGDSQAQDGLRLKRLESAQKRHASAIKLLSSVRSLMPAASVPAKTLRIFEPSEEVA